MLNTREKINLLKEINKLKRNKNAVLLSHYYQRPEIQDIADFVGDSLALAKYAANSKADIIVLCGVKFMAETAKILNKTKKVLFPDKEASCSLADGCSASDFEVFKNNNPNHATVTYINCSAEIKALSDIICTSSNAKKIIESFPKEQAIIFAPDRNLGKYLIKETGRNLTLWDGVCVVHEAFSFQKLIDLCIQYPEAKIVAHPESESSILDTADFIGSTSAMLDYIKKSSHYKFLIATEVGILHQLRKEVPNKILIPVPTNADNTCSCSECAFMKLNTLEKIYHCLLFEIPEIKLSDELIVRAAIPLHRMLELSN